MPRGLTLSDVELDLARKIFAFYDKDKSGALDVHELGPFLADLAEDLSPDEVAQVAKDMDTDGSGTVDFEEFLVYWQADPEGPAKDDAAASAANDHHHHHDHSGGGGDGKGDGKGHDSDDEYDHAHQHGHNKKHIFLAFVGDGGAQRAQGLIDSLGSSGYRLYTPTASHSSINDIIANGIEHASAVVVVPSPGFEDDHNALKMLNYADQRKVTLIQCQQPDFNPTGWLGALLAPTPSIADSAEECLRVLGEKNIDLGEVKLQEGEEPESYGQDNSQVLFHGGSTDGTVESYYFQEGAKTPVDLEFISLQDGRVIGQGDDVVGAFTIAGSYELAGRDGTISFAKVYIGAHTVDYEGRLTVSADNKILGMGGIWSIEGGNLGEDKFTMMMALSPEVQERLAQASKPTFAGTGTKIMLSYAAGQYDLAVVIGAELSKLGASVVVPSHRGSSMMRALIKDARVVVPLMSAEYQNEALAQKILTYADAAKMPIVPAMAQANWSQSGWLGVICAGALWTDVSVQDEAKLTANVAQLYKEIQPHLLVDKDGDGVPDTVDEEDNEPHVMLSYQWGSQELVKKVAGVLKDKNLPIWFDIDGDMTGNINKAMASGVENAVVLVAFTSEAYGKSANCQKELTYASQLSKNIIPVTVDEALDQESAPWMSKIASACDRVNLQDQEQFDAAMDDLVKRVEMVLAAADQGPKTAKAPTLFPGGSVTGHYKYGNDEQDDMTFEFFRLVKGTIAGQGDDPVGPFVIAGTYAPHDPDGDGRTPTYKMHFGKQYVGKHLVDYDGDMVVHPEDGVTFRITGEWSIDGGAYGRGDFMLQG